MLFVWSALNCWLSELEHQTEPKVQPLYELIDCIQFRCARGWRSDFITTRKHELLFLLISPLPNASICLLISSSTRLFNRRSCARFFLANENRFFTVFFPRSHQCRISKSIPLKRFGFDKTKNGIDSVSRTTFTWLHASFASKPNTVWNSNIDWRATWVHTEYFFFARECRHHSKYW